MDKERSLCEQAPSVFGSFFKKKYNETKDENWLIAEKNETILKEERKNIEHYDPSERQYEIDSEKFYRDSFCDDFLEGDSDNIWNID
ncbi:MAG: hypothetical protein HY841_14430 [Bacteroidetes bacterium]|nr:hypothetical protein [Bacteroidota bacterium]